MERPPILAAALCLTVLFAFAVAAAFQEVRSRLPLGARDGVIGSARGSANGISNADIFTIDPGTRTKTDVTRSAHLAESQAAWSADGTHVAFVGEIGVKVEGGSSATDALYVMNADGTSRRRLSVCGSHCFLGYPAWSHDGTRLAFTRSEPGDASLDVYDLATGQVSTICSDDPCGRVDQPVWSPYGDEIAFSDISFIPRGPLLGPSPSSIWIASADGSSTRRVTPGDTAEGCHTASPTTPDAGCFSDASPVWSPDGTTIAFSRYESQTGFQLDGPPGSGVEIMNSDGSGLRNVFWCERECGQNLAPAFSPDGSRLAVATQYRSTIELIGVSSSDRTIFSIQTCLTRRCVAPLSLAWAPSETRLAFADDSGALYIVRVDTGGFARIVHPGWRGAQSAPTWLPAVDTSSTE